MPNKYTVTDYGVKINSPDDQSVAIQKAILQVIKDNAIQGVGSMNTEPVNIYFPGNRYKVSQPIFAPVSQCTISGDGNSSIFDMRSFGISSFPLVLGRKIDANYTDGSTDSLANYRIPTDGRLDSSGGGRYSLCSKGKRFGFFINSPLSSGCLDAWENTQELCIEFSFEHPGGPIPDNTYLFGIGDLATIGSFQFRTQNGQFLFQFRTQEGFAETPRYFSFGNTTKPGRQYGWLWVSLLTGAIAASQNGSQATVTPGWGTRNKFHQQQVIFDNATTGTYNVLLNDATFIINNTMSVLDIQKMVSGILSTGVLNVKGQWNNWTLQYSKDLPTIQIAIVNAPSTASINVFTEPMWNGRLHFIRNDEFPFGLFAGLVGALSPTYGISDLICDGLAFRTQCPYDLTQNSDIRLDGKPALDAYRYFTSDQNTICYLGLIDKPTDPNRTTDILIGAYHGPKAGDILSYGFLIPDSAKENFNTIGEDYVDGIKCEVIGNWGGGLLAIDLIPGSFGRITCHYGWRGFNIWGGYDYTVAFLDALGTDAAIFVSNAQITIDHVKRVDVGRTLLRIVDGDVIIGNDLRTANFNAYGQTTDSVVMFHNNSGYGQRFLLYGGVQLDMEGSPFIGSGVFVFERGGIRYCNFEVDTIECGNVNGRPIFVLKNGHIDHERCGYATLKIRRYVAGDVIGPQIVCDGDSWLVLVDEVETSLFDGEFLKAPNGISGYLKCYSDKKEPAAGRWLKDTCAIITKTNGLKALTCVGSGTAQWVADKYYLTGSYVCFNSQEYLALRDNIGTQPPQDTLSWKLLGPCHTATFK